VSSLLSVFASQSMIPNSKSCTRVGSAVGGCC